MTQKYVNESAASEPFDGDTPDIFDTYLAPLKPPFHVVGRTLYDSKGIVAECTRPGAADALRCALEIAGEL